MKKKSIVVLALLVCALLLLTTAGSLAYFTDADTAHNVITSGNVDITLKELMENDEGELVPYERRDSVMPGTEVSKIVQVENVGSGDAWVRIIFREETDFGEDMLNDAEVMKQKYQLDFNTTDWEKHTEKGGETVYYYRHELAPGETTKPLITKVVFPAEMGNAYQNKNISLDFMAQAVQVKNNGKAAMDADGWPAIPKP